MQILLRGASSFEVWESRCSNGNVPPGSIREDDSRSKGFQSHYKPHCLQFYLVSLPSIYRWMGY